MIESLKPIAEVSSVARAAAIGMCADTEYFAHAEHLLLRRGRAEPPRVGLGDLGGFGPSGPRGGHAPRDLDCRRRRFVKDRVVDEHAPNVRVACGAGRRAHACIDTQ